jgi:hypothetical protein
VLCRESAPPGATGRVVMQCLCDLSTTACTPPLSIACLQGTMLSRLALLLKCKLPRSARQCSCIKCQLSVTAQGAADRMADSVEKSSSKSQADLHASTATGDSLVMFRVDAISLIHGLQGHFCWSLRARPAHLVSSGQLARSV